MKLAFIFAGQGSQRPGMGQDFYDAFPAVRPLYELRPEGLDLRRLSFEADAAALARTEHTQPCMGAFAAAVTLMLESSGVLPDAAMGLSLGEYGALHAAGVLSAEALVSLLAFRGRAMAEAAEGIDSAMAAVFTGDAGAVARAVELSGGSAWCCNFNSPGQVVIGGEAAAVAAAAEKCMEMGAKRVVPLNVGGPFHTPLMAPAAQKLAQRLKSEPLGRMTVPVAFNATGGLLPEGGAIAEMLARQIQSPVLFEAGLRTLLSIGVDTFIEIGPGRVLAGFVKKIAPGAAVCSIEDVPSFYRAVEAIKGGKA